MTALLFLIPLALLMAGAGLAACFWCLRSGQYDDLQGAAVRVLIEDDTDDVPDDR
jgi:cbb3-type cytochrome oxidase maturation protein